MKLDTLDDLFLHELKDLLSREAIGKSTAEDGEGGHE